VEDGNRHHRLSEVFDSDPGLIGNGIGHWISFALLR
jgi:hypothetical protein